MTMHHVSGFYSHRKRLWAALSRETCVPLLFGGHLGTLRGMQEGACERPARGSGSGATPTPPSRFPSEAECSLFAILSHWISAPTQRGILNLREESAGDFQI